MANDGANSATFTFATAAPNDVRSIDFDNSAAEIDVTALTDSRHLYECGLPNEAFDVEVVGTVTVAVADKGTAAITWNDAAGGTESITNCVIVAISTSGAVDGEISTRLRFRPSKADGS